MNQDEFIILIVKELNGNISPKEQSDLRAFIDRDETNRNTYHEVKLHWKNAAKFQPGVQPDTDKSWSRFINRAGSRPSIRFVPLLLRLAAVLILGLGVFYYFYAQALAKTELTTGPGEKKEVMLPDGSKIWLNESTYLAYDENFNKDARSLELRGRAYFEVSRDVRKPFTVQAEHTTVKVLGTSFMVDARPGAPYELVNVSSGKVSFQAGGDKELILEKGMSGVFSLSNQTLTTIETPTKNYDSWRTGTLVFEDALLTEVMNDLQAHYSVSISFANKSLGSCRFTGEFTDLTIREILDVISAALNLTIRQVGEGYVLTGDGCNP